MKQFEKYKKRIKNINKIHFQKNYKNCFFIYNIFYNIPNNYYIIYNNIIPFSFAIFSVSVGHIEQCISPI